MPFTPLPHQTGLPLTETVEGLVSVMIYGQTQLEMKGEIQQKQARVIHLITNKCPLRKSAHFQNLCVNQLTGSCSRSNKLTTTMLMSVPMVPSLKRLETCEEEEENTFTQWYTITNQINGLWSTSGTKQQVVELCCVHFRSLLWQRQMSICYQLCEEVSVLIQFVFKCSVNSFWNDERTEEALLMTTISNDKMTLERRLDVDWWFYSCSSTLLNVVCC